MGQVIEGALQKTTYAALTDLLRQDIVSGRLPAGARVTVAEVASRYGVSQMPVREALQCLQGEGIVTLQPHKGASVLALDEKFVCNIYDLRGAVESLLARLSLPNLTNAAMARLEDLCQQVGLAVEKGDVKLVLAVNSEFHSLLYRHADNPVALEIYNRYAGLMGTLRQKYGVGPGRLIGIAGGLVEVMEAIRAQDADRLGRLLPLQCELAKQDLLRLIAQEQEPQMAKDVDPTTTRLLKASSR